MVHAHGRDGGNVGPRQLLELPVHGRQGVCQRRDQVWGLPVLVPRATDGLLIDRDDHPAADLRGLGPEPGAENPVQHVRADQGERAPKRGLPAIQMASSPASGSRRSRLLPGSGIRARRSGRYWLRAAGIGRDGIGGHVSLVGGDGSRSEPHRSRVPPATRRHAGHTTRRQTSQVTASIHDFAGSLGEWSSSLSPSAPAILTSPPKCRGRACSGTLRTPPRC